MSTRLWGFVVLLHQLDADEGRGVCRKKGERFLFTMKKHIFVE